MTLSQCFKVRHLILAAVLISGLGLVNHATAQERPFFIDLNTRTVTPLGTLAEGFILAEDINDAGQVVGWSYMPGGPHRAFITGPDGMGMRDLDPLGGNYIRAYGINDVGQVVGRSDTAEGGRAFITGPNGMGMRDLGTLGGGSSWAYDINDAGQMVGASYTANGPPRLFITDANGIDMRELDTLAGTYYIDASGINDAGQVVEWFSPSGHRPERAFITGPDGTGMRDLGTLGDEDSDSGASDINNAGQVVGGSRTGETGGISHAFITGSNGMGMRDLGTLGGGDSHALGLNDAGQVVGRSHLTGDDYNFHAFITGPNGVDMMDLNSLVDLPRGIVLTEAIDINNNGQVIALASIVPEPETYALMLSGLGLIGFMGRRKKPEVLI